MGGLGASTNSGLDASKMEEAGVAFDSEEGFFTLGAFLSVLPLFLERI